MKVPLVQVEGIEWILLYGWMYLYMKPILHFKVAIHSRDRILIT